jgi:hypothetical protein
MGPVISCEFSPYYHYIILLGWLNQEGWNGKAGNDWKFFVGKLHGKRPFRWRTCRWEDNAVLKLK